MTDQTLAYAADCEKPKLALQELYAVHQKSQLSQDKKFPVVWTLNIQATMKPEFPHCSKQAKPAMGSGIHPSRHQELAWEPFAGSINQEQLQLERYHPLYRSLVAVLAENHPTSQSW